MSQNVGKSITRLVLAVAITTTVTVSNLQAGKNCGTPVEVTLRSDIADDVQGPAYWEAATISCPNTGSDLNYSYSALGFRHLFLGPEFVTSSGNLHVEIGELGFNDPSFAVGTEHARMTSKLQFAFTVNRKNYFLAFRPSLREASGSTNVTVTRTSETEWVLEALVACVPATDPVTYCPALAQLLTIEKGVYKPQGVPEEVPFQMTVRLKP